MGAMRGYEVRVAVDLDRVEEAARHSGRDIDDLLNEFAQRLQETGESLVESWSADQSGSPRPVLPSGHEIVDIPGSSSAP
jgi:hypothetical protein